jgi:hypothetical protein
MTVKEAEFIFENEALNLSKGKLHFHTIQFLTKASSKFNYDFKPYGSGVLIQIQNHFLIFTASHVTVNAQNEPLYINTRIGEQQVIGSCHQTNLNDDKLCDLAYIILDKMLGLLLSETYQFLPLTKISHSHIPKETTNYMVSGYPEKNVWQYEGDMYTGSSHFLLNMANEKVYKYYNLDLSKNYALSFSGKGMDILAKEKTKIGDPYGISGCGLWYLQARPVLGKIILEYLLIGIMTEFKKSKYHILIGNRVELMFQDLEETLQIKFDWNVLSS